MVKSGKHGVKSGRHHRIHSYEPDDADFGMRQLAHQLASQSLYIKEIIGDGNCLFRSLADQLGDSSISHAQIRHEVVTHLRRHAEMYAAFVEEDFDVYLDRMAQDGVYGDNLEVVGFANAYGRRVKIYQPDLAYVVAPEKPSEGDMLHIAYHSWEHYSSIRNKDGPHDGPPCVSIKAVDLPPLPERAADAPASDMEKICLASVPGSTLDRVRETMEKCEGKLNDAVEMLLEEQAQADVESALQDRAVAPEAESGEADGALETEARLQDTLDHERTRASKCSAKQQVKRISARERKEQAKKAQKEAALERKRQKKGVHAAVDTGSLRDSFKTMLI
jgi:hypothetical protein